MAKREILNSQNFLPAKNCPKNRDFTLFPGNFQFSVSQYCHLVCQMLYFKIEERASRQAGRQTSSQVGRKVRTKEIQEEILEAFTMPYKIEI